MTKISGVQRLSRETEAYHRGRALVVELGSFALDIRHKGKRTRYTVPYEAIYDLGAKLEARKAAAEKVRKKAAGRNNRTTARRQSVMLKGGLK